jgi:hypothetical protein
MVLKGLSSVRKAYKLWRGLPPAERAQHGAEIRRIRALVREVSGSRGLRYMEGTDIAGSQDGETEQPPEPQRSRGAALEELQEASSSLAAALAKPAGSLAVDAVPRSVRFAGRVAGRSIARHVERARLPAAPGAGRVTVSPEVRALPADLVERLEPFGRFEYDPQGSGVDAVGHPNADYELLQVAKRDPGGFLAALAAATIPIGGWTVYGAMRLTWHFDLLTADGSGPDADQIGLEALLFLRDRGDAWDRLSLDEKALWNRTAGQAW